MKQIFSPATLLCFLLIGLNGLSQNNEIKDTSITGKVFELGEVRITGMKSQTAITLDENEQFNRLDVAHSLNLIPSLTLSSFGARNESTIYLRGFDIRQIPVYIDGIPVYVPYDGYIDMGRFTAFDLSEIDVSKGFSSILYGPNTLGGSINLVTIKPKNKLEVSAIVGAMSGEGYKTSINAGSNLGKFYIQGGFSRLKKDNYPLSDDFDTVKVEDGGARDNSYRQDSKASIKVGFTPNSTDEYSVSYIYQHGEKGTPVYTGSDPTIKIRYWQWPYWDKESVYFISKTTVKENSYVKTKLFYDKFKNKLNSYDNDSYTTQAKPYAFQSLYFDETMGATVEAGTTLIPKNNLKAAAHFKNDKHSDRNLGEPIKHCQDNTFSLGLEDNFGISNSLMLVLGASYNFRKSVNAEDYNSTTQEISDFPTNESDAIDVQLGIYYNLSQNHRVSGTFARKTRFATMKDRYSYKIATAIPNPDLKSENAINYELAYNGTFAEKINVKPALFYSKIKDVIQSVNNVFEDKTQMQNMGEAEFLGGEITVIYEINKKVKTGLNYTYIERQNISNPEVKFTDVPNHKIIFTALYKPIERIEIALSGEYNSERYSTSYGNTAPEFAVFNIRIAGSIWKYLSAELGVNNMLDKNYYLCEGYPEEGRNYYGSLIYKFN